MSMPASLVNVSFSILLALDELEGKSKNLISDIYWSMETYLNDYGT